MQRGGGLITAEDLAQYQAKERAPIRGTYRGYEIVSMPPPSSGGVALVEMLNILEGYDLAAAGHNSPKYVHLVAEAMRRAFVDRAHYLGDPDFVENPIDRLTSKSYAAELRKTIQSDHATVSSPAQVAQGLESHAAKLSEEKDRKFAQQVAARLWNVAGEYKRALQLVDGTDVAAEAHEGLGDDVARVGIEARLALAQTPKTLRKQSCSCH